MLVDSWRCYKGNSEIQPETYEIKSHYPLPQRILLELLNAGELPNIHRLIFEPKYGYIGRIEYVDGSIRLFRGSNLDVNSHGASELSKDKGYTKFLLQQLGYSTPAGQVFLLPRYVHLIDENLSRYGFAGYETVDQIDSYVRRHFGYPCFIKPNDGSQGYGVFKCWDESDVQFAVENYQQENRRALIVEEAVNYPDYRIVIYNQQFICCYRRVPLSVTGDGKSTVRELLQQKQAAFAQQGRSALIKLSDPRIEKRLNHNHLSLESILEQDQQIQIHDFSNVSLGGELIDYTDTVHSHWKELSRSITHELGLNFCGVDLACADITSADSEYAIIESNASPGLDNYAASGPEQMKIVRELYQQIFSQSKSEGGNKP